MVDTLLKFMQPYTCDLKKKSYLKKFKNMVFRLEFFRHDGDGFKINDGLYPSRHQRGCGAKAGRRGAHQAPRHFSHLPCYACSCNHSSAHEEVKKTSSLRPRSILNPNRPHFTYDQVPLSSSLHRLSKDKRPQILLPHKG